MNLHKVWFYYRYGYALYLAMILSGVNTLILVYFTMGDVVFVIRDTFPHFLWFLSTAIIIGVPTLIIVGYLHYRFAYKSEAEVIVKRNPYHYKLPDGHNIEVLFPILYELINYLEQQNPNRSKEYAVLKKKLELLLAGGSVGQSKI